MPRLSRAMGPRSLASCSGDPVARIFRRHFAVRSCECLWTGRIRAAVQSGSVWPDWPQRALATRSAGLFINPGGPGGAASEALAAQASGQAYFTKAVTEHFDLICMDPRGVGLSAPVRCDPALFNQPVSLLPTDHAGFDALVAHNRAFGESCLRRTSPLLRHLDAVQQARDMEAVRRALGQANSTTGACPTEASSAPTPPCSHSGDELW
jgi:hypothetical protein